MRLLFAGTPAVALPSLERLIASDHEVVAVLTRPDARSGRGRALAPSPVRERAERLGVEVLTPTRPSDPAFLERLAELAVDAAPVVAYGALIPATGLAVPAHGWVNLHFSLLPAWRGAAPVQRALIAGDEVTGATTFRLEQGLDTGPVFGTMTEAVRPRDTAGDLLARLSVAGAELLLATLDGLERGSVEARPQPGEGVSLAPKVTVEEARVDWRRPGPAIDRLVRGCTPAPGAWTTYAGARLKLLPVAVASTGAGDPDPAAADGWLPPGEVRVDRHRVAVGSATGPVLLGDVQPQGKRPMPAADWARGVRLESGDRMGEP